MNTIDPNQVQMIIDNIKTEIQKGIEQAIQKTNPDIARRYEGNNIQIKNIMGNGLTIRKNKTKIEYIPNGNVDLNLAEQTFPSLPVDIDTSVKRVANRLLTNIHDQFKTKRTKTTIPQPPPFIPQNVVKPSAMPPPFIKP